MIGYCLQFIIPMLFILGLALFVSASFKLSFENSIPIGILTSVLMTFLFGFMDLRIGLYLSCVISASSLPIAAMRVKKGSYDIKSIFFNAYLLAFLMLYSFIFVLNAGKVFDRWDEYSHWGLMAKEMYRLNRYYYVKESVLTAHREYPPFGQIWQYIWCKLIGSFKESSLYNAKLTLCLSILLSAVARVDRRSSISLPAFFKSLMLSALVVLLAAIPDLVDGSMYRTIYAEGTMIVLTVYIIISVLYPTGLTAYDMVALGLGVASLVLVKQIGAFFASISMLILFLRFIMIHNNFNKTFGNKEIKSFNEINKASAKLLVVNVLALIIPWLIWNRISVMHTSSGQFDSSKFSVSGILSVLQGEGTESQYICIEKYLPYLFVKKLTWIPGTSYMVLMLILIIVLFFLYRHVGGIKQSENSSNTNVLYHPLSQIANKEVIVSVLIVLPIITIIYAVIMQILYLFGFTEAEMALVVCYLRYMNPMIGMWIMVVILLFLNCYRNTKQFIIVLMTSAALIGPSRYAYEFVPGLLTSNHEGAFVQDVRNIDSYTDVGSKIYLVSSYGNDSHGNIIRFLANGKYISDMYVAPKVSDFENVVSYLSGFDYMYLYGIDDEFIDAYKGLFKGNQIISERQLYKICPIGDKIELLNIDMEDTKDE